MKIEHFVFVIYLFQQFSFIFYNPHYRRFLKPDIMGLTKLIFIGRRNMMFWKKILSLCTFDHYEYQVKR